MGALAFGVDAAVVFDGDVPARSGRAGIAAKHDVRRIVALDERLAAAGTDRLNDEARAVRALGLEAAAEAGVDGPAVIAAAAGRAERRGGYRGGNRQRNDRRSE